MTPLLVENVFKSYKRPGHVVTALRGVNLAVSPAQFLAVMGASGSGKSTLLHLMAGLTSPDSGRVLINGQDITTMSDRDLTLFRRRYIGLVFQAFNLVPTLTAAQNIALPLMLDGRSPSDIHTKAQQLLDILGLASRRDHRPDVLSGGEQQRVAIGRALVADPAIILADEPTGNLDSVSSKAICELLRQLSDLHARAIVMVTHEPSVAAYAHEVAVMKDGRLIGRFPTAAAGAQELALRYQECIQSAP